MMKGYTLIELIIVIFVFSIILLSVFSFTFSISKTSIQLANKSDTFQSARLALDFIAEEISLCSVYGLKITKQLEYYSDESSEIFEGRLEGLKLKKSDATKEVNLFTYVNNKNGEYVYSLNYGGGTNISTTTQLLASGIVDLIVSANPQTKILTVKMVTEDFTLIRKISLKYKKSGNYFLM